MEVPLHRNHAPLNHRAMMPATSSRRMHSWGVANLGSRASEPSTQGRIENDIFLQPTILVLAFSTPAHDMKNRNHAGVMKDFITKGRNLLLQLWKQA